jgi:hypothetical protein
LAGFPIIAGGYFLAKIGSVPVATMGALLVIVASLTIGRHAAANSQASRPCRPEKKAGTFTTCRSLLLKRRLAGWFLQKEREA